MLTDELKVVLEQRLDYHYFNEACADAYGAHEAAYVHKVRAKAFATVLADLEEANG